jgi:hypothetical protein
VDRTIVPIDDMPASLQHAVVSAEDKGFYEHSGIDPVGIVRAAWTDLVAHETVQGGSTITQQVVKNVYAGTYSEDPVTHQQVYTVPPRTFGQKIREALLAIKVEHEFTKDQILALYLNTVYFGHGAYGVQAAAQTYWSKDSTDLTLLESATLAGLIPSPSLFDPILHPEDAKTRRNYVLDRMVADGYLQADRAAVLKDKQVRTEPLANADDFPRKLGYFLDYTRRSLIAQFTEPVVFGGGLQVTTTLDRQLQSYAEDAVAGRLDTPGDPEAALVAIDPKTGGVLAMVGGSNWDRSQVNLATGDGGTGRQAGSAFKPFTLVAAMEDRISLNSRWNGPGSITIPDKACYTNGQPWELSNASDSEAGVFTLAQAVAHSVNTVFAQLVTVVGPDAVVDVAHRMGITSPLDPVCSITLGTQAVSPLEMTAAYATLAARGIRRVPYVTNSVRALYVNMEDPVLGGMSREHIALRRAVALGIDAETLIKVIYAGQGLPANQLMPPGLSGHDPAWPKREYDPALAAALLDRMGYGKRDAQGMRLTPDGKPLTVVLTIFTGTVWREIQTLLKKNMDALGVRLDFRAVPVQDLFKEVAQGKFMLAIHGRSLSPMGLGYGQFYGPNPPEGNESRFRYAPFDRAYEAFLRAATPEERAREARTLTAILYYYAPYMPLLVDVQNAFVQPWLKGYAPSPFGAYYQYMDVDRGKAP